MITLAIGQIVWGVAYRWISITNGDNGISVTARPSPLGFSLASPAHFYWATLVVFVAALGSMAILVASPFGASLRGTRDQPRRMAALGYHVWMIRFLAFLLSGFWSGVAGLLFLYYNQFVSPQAVALTASAEALLMVISGGSGTLLGPVVGAALVVVMKNVASAYIERWNFVLGAIFVAIVVFMPEGLVPGAARLWRRATARPAAPAVAAVAAPGERARPMTGPSTALAVQRLTKSFGGLLVTASVDLTVEAGERRLIIGPNGAGKTTLFNLVTGELRPDGGTVTLFGRDITRIPGWHRAHLGISRTYQIITLFPRETLLRNVTLSLLGRSPLRWNPVARLGAPGGADRPGARGAGPRRARAPGGAAPLADVLRGAAARGDRHGPRPGPPDPAAGRALRRALHRGAARRAALGQRAFPETSRS